MRPQSPHKTFRHAPPFKGTFRTPVQKESLVACGKWRRMRNIHIMQHPQCARCGKPGDVVHHIVPRHVRPDLTYVWSNLLTLCDACHDLEHAHERKR